MNVKNSPAKEKERSKFNNALPPLHLALSVSFAAFLWLGKYLAHIRTPYGPPTQCGFKTVPALLQMPAKVTSGMSPQHSKFLGTA